MNRREAIAAACGAITALATGVQLEPDSAEYAAMQRIVDKIEAGKVREMFDINLGNGHVEDGKYVVDASIEWTDPDILFLRSRGLLT